LTSKPLSRAAGELLLRLIEHNSLTIDGSTLAVFSADAGQELIDKGALVDAGMSRSFALFDDDSGAARSIDLEWLGDRQAYGYFSASEGYVVPSQDALRLYRLKIEWWLKWLSTALGLRKSGRPVEILPGHAWEIGELAITPRRAVPAIFVRAVRSYAALEQLHRSLRSRYEQAPHLVLTSTRQVVSGSLPDAAIRKSLWLLLTTDAGRFEFDIGLLKPGWSQLPDVRGGEPLQLSTDGYELLVHGQTLRLRGRIQRSIIRKLYQAHTKGTKATTQDVLSDASHSVDTIGKAFRNSKNWSVLKTVIRSKNGLSWFEI